MKKTMKKKCEETTTVTLYIKHALFGASSDAGMGCK